jgi:hypothetical protein
MRYRRATKKSRHDPIRRRPVTDRTMRDVYNFMAATLARQIKMSFFS